MQRVVPTNVNPVVGTARFLYKNGGKEMYQAGDMIIYGSTGVCQVKEIVDRELEKGVTKPFYVLDPLYQDGVIMIPVDTKVFMRPVITKEEAMELIDRIPTMQPDAYHNSVLRELEEHYCSYLKSHRCEDLIELVMSIYCKKQDLAQQHRKFGAMDERFMKRAEDLLDGELAVALGIEKNEVGAFISARVDQLTQK